MFGVPVFAVITDEYQDLYDAYAGGHLLSEGRLARQFHSLSMKIAGVAEESASFVFWITNAKNQLRTAAFARTPAGSNIGAGAIEFQEIKFTLHRRLLDRIT